MPLLALDLWTNGVTFCTPLNWERCRWPHFFPLPKDCSVHEIYEVSPYPAIPGKQQPWFWYHLSPPVPPGTSRRWTRLGEGVEMPGLLGRPFLGQRLSPSSRSCCHITQMSSTRSVLGFKASRPRLMFCPKIHGCVLNLGDMLDPSAGPCHVIALGYFRRLQHHKPAAIEVVEVGSTRLTWLLPTMPKQRGASGCCGRMALRTGKGWGRRSKLASLPLKNVEHDAI